MKKLLTLACLAMASSAFAANPTLTLQSDFISTMPPEFGHNGVTSCLQLYPYDFSTEGGEVVIYDEDLKQIASFTIPGAKVYNLKYWYQEPKMDFRSIKYGGSSEVYPLEIDGEIYGITLAQAFNYLKTQYPGAEIIDLNGDNVIAVGYYENKINGETYLEYYYRYFKYDEIWMLIHNYYEPDDWGPTGEWGEKHENSHTQTASSYCDIYGSINGIETDECMATQSIFNSDSNFEYIVPQYTVITETYENEDRRVEEEKLIQTGYTVMSQTGTKLYDIDSPTGYKLTGSVRIMILGDKNLKKYLVLGAEDNEGIYYRLIYALDGMGGISSPKIVSSGMKVSPRTPRHGEIVNVELGEATNRVDLISANGSKVRSVNANGTASVTISTEGLPTGVYVVSANNREAAKIIIR